MPCLPRSLSLLCLTAVLIVTTFWSFRREFSFYWANCLGDPEQIREDLREHIDECPPASLTLIESSLQFLTAFWTFQREFSFGWVYWLGAAPSHACLWYELIWGRVAVDALGPAERAGPRRRRLREV